MQHVMNLMDLNKAIQSGCLVHEDQHVKGVVSGSSQDKRNIEREREHRGYE
ncbi:hypothetical protein HanRHA438_Chr16g0771431 [Helianthus annuus]|nr:hypothetical protein HanRHA438_Chr16g0771431 [Helianthus annuus]